MSAVPLAFQALSRSYLRHLSNSLLSTPHWHRREREHQPGGAKLLRGNPPSFPVLTLLVAFLTLLRPLMSRSHRGLVVPHHFITASMWDPPLPSSRRERFCPQRLHGF